MLVHLLEKATPENFYGPGYVLANKDLALRKSRGDFDEGDHFRRYGLDEGRLQVLRAFLEDPVQFLASYRATKFERFRSALSARAVNASPGLVSLPMTVGPVQYSRDDYVRESANRTPVDFEEELRKHPDRLFLDVGCGFRTRLFPNCLYLEVYPSLTADVIYEAGAPLPFESGSLDGVGCFAVLEHVPRPWELVDEIWRVLRLGGRVFIAYPFLQPYHGYPHHYFNATRRGLRSLFEQRFSIDELNSRPSETPDHTLNWIVRGIVTSIEDRTLRRRVMKMSIGDLLQHRPGDAFYKDLVASMGESSQEQFACGNMLHGTKIR
jgi:SAM-dependent methyltransferase